MGSPHTWSRCAVVVAAVLVLPASVEAEDPDAGLVAYYAFEGHGDEMVDSSGNGLDGLLGPAERVRDGKFGDAIRFTDNQQTAQVAKNDALVAKADLTVSAWVYPEDLDVQGENRVVFTDQYNLDLLLGKGRWDLFAGGGWRGTPANGPILELETWHHIVGTVLTEDQIGSHYVNGERIGTVKLPGDQLDKVTSPLRLGSCCGQQGFIGRLDDVRIYDRALDEDEVLELFEFEAGRPVPLLGSMATTWGTLKR